MRRGLTSVERRLVAPLQSTSGKPELRTIVPDGTEETHNSKIAMHTEQSLVMYAEGQLISNDIVHANK